MFVHTRSDGTRWTKPVLCLTRHLEISMTDDLCESFPWDAMRYASWSESGRKICLTSGAVSDCHLEQLKAWKGKFSMDIPENHLMIVMKLERTGEELAVAMGKHHRLGQASRFSQLEPEILQLICDLAYN